MLTQTVITYIFSGFFIIMLIIGIWYCFDIPPKKRDKDENREHKLRGKTLAIDFDGVIHRYSKGFKNGKIYDNPVEGVKKAIDKLKNKGYKIIIFTTRLNPMFDDVNRGVRDVKQNIEEWLDKHEIYYDELTNNKPPAIAYIDDRGIRFTNWKDILNYFL